MPHLAVSGELNDQNACVKNVIEEFNDLNTEGQNLKVHVNRKIPGRAFTQAPLAMFGFQNHFQGIQRIHGQPYLLISGGDWWHRQGYVFLIHLGSKHQEAVEDLPFQSNLPRFSKQDRVVTRFKVGDQLHWHPGGMGTSGDILAITTEEFIKTEAGKIFFYDFKNPESPKMIAPPLDLGKQKAGTVDLFKSPEGSTQAGYFFVMTYSGGLLNFYRSLTSNLQDGFASESTKSTAPFAQTPYDGGSAVNIIRQCDGQLFLVSFENTADIAPIQKGKDIATLSRLIFSDEIKTEVITHREFNCGHYCNFGGAAGAYISSDGHLSLYSSKFYRNFVGTQLRFKEFHTFSSSLSSPNSSKN